jgi:hypothetical protein
MMVSFIPLLTIRQVALTVNSRVIQTFIEWSPGATDVPLGNGLRIQVLPCVDDLPKARKNQCAAFLAAESLLVVWDDDPTKVVERATAIENELMNLVWQAGEPADIEQASDAEKVPAVTEAEVDVETGEAVPEHRSTNIINAIQVAFTIMLITTMLGLGYKQIAFQILVDKSYMRVAFVAMTPVLIFFSLVRVHSGFEIACSNICTVLLSSHHHQSFAVVRTHPSDADKFEILLRYTPASHQRYTSSHHRTMSSIQGRTHVCHRTDCEVSETSHLHI